MLFIGHHGAYEYDSVWYTDDGGSTYNLSKTNLTSMDEVRGAGSVPCIEETAQTIAGRPH
jgi:hypothetical protein